MTSTRRLAVELLVRVEGGAHSHAVLPVALTRSDLDQRDRAFVTELVSGTVRMLGALDHLLTKVVDRPLTELDPRVRAGVRLGTYQLVTGTRPHAAVGATVEAVGGRARAYVNAVLRSVAALGPPWPWPAGDDPEAVAVRTSHPRWLVERLVIDLGVEEALGVLETDNEAPMLTLRPNPARATPDEVAEELRRNGATVTTGRLVPEAVVVRGGGAPARMAAVVQGRATPQDEASQAVVSLVGASPRERVLEVGAGPGGKTTALAEHGAWVLGVDADRGRLRMLEEAAARVGVRAAALAADGRVLPLRPASFDRVLVDAPCSGLGVLRRRADARWNVTPEQIPELEALQRALLAEAARVVKPGGVLVYSVCTLTAAETVAVDDWARDALTEFEATEAPGAPWRRVGRGARLLPQARSTDGMYVLRLERAGSPSAGKVWP